MTEFERRALRTFTQIEATMKVVRAEINALNSLLGSAQPQPVRVVSSVFGPNGWNARRLAALRAE